MAHGSQLTKSEYAPQDSYRARIKERLERFDIEAESELAAQTIEDGHIATFDATVSSFSQNSRGDYRIILNVPYRYSEAVVAMAKAHGILLTINVDRWKNDAITGD